MTDDTQAAIDFHGCYDESWKGLIVDAAFAHPAKAARGLVRRIFAHMEEQGWLPSRSRVLDVFGGIATTAIEGASRGHEVVCVELEKKFFDLALENFQLHRNTWEQMGDTLPVILHGDSRKAAELVRGHFAGSVGSPPFSAPGNQPDSVLVKGGRQGVRSAMRAAGANSDTTYGTTSGQLGAMSEGDVDAVVGSPPFSGIIPSQANQEWHQKRACIGKNNSLGVSDYGTTPGQLGTMPDGTIDAAIGSPPYAETPVTGQGNFQSKKYPGGQPAMDARADGYDAVVGSPPYAGSFSGDKVESADLENDMRRRGCSEQSIKKAIGNGHTGNLGYGTTNGQLGKLSEGEIDAVLSSPPYASGVVHDGNGIDQAKLTGNKAGKNTQAKVEGYGVTPGQLGIEQAETFWLAARQILEQVHQLVRPGGVCAWIVKDYVKNGKRVPFCDNWARLCEATGFEVIQRARCWLVKEVTHAGLFGDVTKRTERKSFFRRLHERKPGAVRIDWEEVVFVRRSS